MIPIRILAITIAAAGLLGSAEDSSAAGPQVQAGAAIAKGMGATFPQPVYAEWARLAGAEAGPAVTYQGVGSGAGVKAIRGEAATFGATDVPLDEAAQTRDALVQFPTLVGGVVPVVEVPGVGPGDLVLDGQTLADLFMGRIAFWDDPAVLRLNPHLPLPHLAVVPVRRSDSSGTTAVFAGYLARASSGWNDWLGQDPPSLRPVGAAAEGSRGMADAVAATAGAIGYVGFDFAQANHLTYADLVNPAGSTVQPTLASIAAAAEAADWSQGLTTPLVAQPGSASWPIVSATYVLMRRTNADVEPARAALRFFAWATRFGGPAAEDLGFVPLPEAVEVEVRRRLDGVGDASGRPIPFAR